MCFTVKNSLKKRHRLKNVVKQVNFSLLKVRLIAYKPVLLDTNNNSNS